MNRHVIADINSNMRSPGIASPVEEQEIEWLILVDDDRMLCIVP